MIGRAANPNNLSAEIRMPEYEIRFLRPDRQTSAVILEQSHRNDEAAIDAAAKLANGVQFEVWRDLDCVYQQANI
jgi:hypothetical protein